MQEDETHGLLVAPAPGAGDARDRDGEVRSRALVPTEEVALEWSHESLRQLVGAGFCSRLDDQVDVDLEVAGADRRLHPVAVAPCFGQRLCHGRLTRAEEP